MALLKRWRRTWLGRYLPSRGLVVLAEAQFKRQAAARQQARSVATAWPDLGLCLLEVQIEQRQIGTPGPGKAPDLPTMDRVGRVLAQGLRAVDLLGDGGPGRFLIVLSEVNARSARMAAERLCALILDAQHRDAGGTVMSLQVAVAMAAAPPGQDLDATWTRLHLAPVSLPRGQRHHVKQLD